MAGLYTATPMPIQLEKRLRAALAQTHDREPRPLTPIELPFGLDKLLTPSMVKALRPASVLVPVIRHPKQLTVLLTKRSENLRSHKGQISFPGGRREDSDETAAHAALREAQEEVGLDPAQVEVIGYLDDYLTVTRYRVTPVVGFVSAPPKLKLDEGEVAEAFEVPLELLVQESSYERKVFSKSGMNIPFFEVNHEGRRIWGATAGMLRNLMEKMKV